MIAVIENLGNLNRNQTAINITLGLLGISGGYILGFVHAYKSHSEKKQLNQIKRFISDAPVAISMLDRDMRYVAASKRWLSDYNLENRQILGVSHYEIFPEISGERRAIHQQSLAGSTQSSAGDLFIRKDGSKQWLKWEIKPWGLDKTSTKPGGLFIFSEDITDRKIAEQEASESLADQRVSNNLRIEAERLSHAKDQFIATLSHELRNPLHAMLAWIQVLHGKHLTLDRLKQAVGAIERCARSQAKIVSDILDINRITSGKLRLNCQSIAIAILIDHTIEAALPEAELKKIEVRGSTIPSCLQVFADEARLRQCLWNLLTNALKFTPAGGLISIKARQLAGAIEIAVSDSGKGISAELLPHIFERWNQGDASGATSQSGLGLGLEIVRNLVELHGGTIRAESGGKNHGSTFTLEIPSPAVDDTALHPEDLIKAC